MIQAVLLDKVSLSVNDLNLSHWFQLPIDFKQYHTTQPEQLLQRIHQADIILTNKVILDESAFAAAPQLKLIILLATGTNNVDLVAAKNRNIHVCHMVDYSTESVAQHVIAVMLAMASKLFQYQKAIQQGRWQRSEFFGLLDFPAIELRGCTLGLVGYGAIAKRVEHFARAIGMEILIAQSVAQSSMRDQTVQSTRIPLMLLLSKVDFLSLHCPLTAQTCDLISYREIAMMKKSAHIINTARGGIINESALADALRNGDLAGAAVDVLTEEPPKSHHVLLAEDIPNLILTPHSAWSSRSARQNLVDQTYQLLKMWCEQGEVNIQRVV